MALVGLFGVSKPAFPLTRVSETLAPRGTTQTNPSHRIRESRDPLDSKIETDTSNTGNVTETTPQRSLRPWLPEALTRPYFARPSQLTRPYLARPSQLTRPYSMTRLNYTFSSVSAPVCVLMHVSISVSISVPQRGVRRS